MHQVYLLIMKVGYFNLLRAFAFAGVTFFASCNNSLFNDCTKGEGPSKTFFSSTDSFKKLNLKIPAKIIIKQDSNAFAPQLEVFAQENVFNRIAFANSGSEVTIDFKECVNQYQDVEIKIIVSDFNNLSLDGPSDVFSDNIFRTDSFSIQLNSTAIIDFSTRADYFTVDVNGAGNISLNGYSDVFQLTHNRVGGVSAFNLETDSSNITINNAGSAEITVGKSLTTITPGLGQVFYKGRPNLFVSDSSKVIDSNL